MWPYVEDDHMEIGNSGWVPVGEGLFKNMKTGKEEKLSERELFESI